MVRETRAREVGKDLEPGGEVEDQREAMVPPFLNRFFALARSTCYVLKSL